MSLCCTDGPATEADGPRVSAHVSKTTTRKKEFDGVVRCLIESQDRPANALRRSACRAPGCAIRSRFLIGPVEPHRVVHEQPLLLLRRSRDLRDEIHQQPVVRHVVLQIRVRPVGAPEHAVRERFD